MEGLHWDGPVGPGRQRPLADSEGKFSLEDARRCCYIARTKKTQRPLASWASEAFSFQIATDNQDETDRYWNAIVSNGGEESGCGWCRDRWGLSWQITPRTLTEAMAAGGGEAKRAFSAMMTMRKIDVAAIDAARRG